MEIYKDGIKVGGDGSGGGAGITSESFPVDFSYMQLSKCFTSGSIGWVTERNNTSGYLYTCGGYESASASLQSGQAYIELPIPAGATGFGGTGFQLAFVANNTGVSQCKMDIKLYTTADIGGTSNLIYTESNFGAATANVPEVKNIVPTGAFSAGRLVAELTFYSINSKSIKILGGTANFVS